MLAMLLRNIGTKKKKIKKKRGGAERRKERKIFAVITSILDTIGCWKLR